MKLDIQSVVDGITAVRQKIGAEVIPWSSDVGWVPIDPNGFGKTLDTIGEIVDVDLEDIQVCPDGTFEIEGRKVLLYIRDIKQTYYDRYGSLPKFHVANCETLLEKRREGKIDKYVASTKTDGKFKIRKLKHIGDPDESEEALSVCKYCLRRLNYKKYVGLNRSQQKEIYEGFSLKEFFELYNATGIIEPKYNDITAPTNDYTKDWEAISNERKRLKNYMYERCHIRLSSRSKFLQVHHVNGRKDNNRPENLKVLCIACHAEQGRDHAHIKNKSDYKEFMRTYTRRDFQR